MKEHFYKINTKWNGNNDDGNRNIRKYDRSHSVSIANKPVLHLTTDNKAVGDANKLNPEDLLVSAVSSCHMLSYLYVCALEGIVVLDYIDNAIGTLIENENGGGQFQEIVLNPEIIVAHESMMEKAIVLHHKAHEICYIANSVNFEIKCYPICKVK
ncbi:MAG: OsmC family protein [Bacteroidia bacterium]